MLISDSLWQVSYLLNLCVLHLCSGRPSCLGDFGDLLAPKWATRLLEKHGGLQRDN